jgi:hypothetical protein
VNWFFLDEYIFLVYFEFVDRKFVEVFPSLFYVRASMVSFVWFSRIDPSMRLANFATVVELVQCPNKMAKTGYCTLKPDFQKASLILTARGFPGRFFF